MLGKLKRKITENKYRFQLRQTLQQATSDELKITLEETRKEIERRNKKKGK